MSFRIRKSSIGPMLEVIKKLKKQKLGEEDIDLLLEHEDYQMEFSRYRAISKDDFKSF